MKLSKRGKVALLLGALAVIIAAGSAAVLFSSGGGGEVKKPDGQAVDAVGLGSQELRYQEEVALEAPWEGNLTGRTDRLFTQMTRKLYGQVSRGK